MIGIKAIASYFPENVIKINDLPENKELSGDQKMFLQTLGINTIVQAESISSIDLAAKASQKVLEKEDLTADDIDVIILLQSRVPDYLMSSEATHLQKEIGATKALSFTISDLGCVGISCALMLAKSILVSDLSKKNILIAYGSKPFTERRFRYPVTITGDGGCSLIVSRCDTLKIVDLEIETNGKYWNLYKVDFKDKSTKCWREECRNLDEYSFGLSIESRLRFRNLNDTIFQRHGIGYQDIQHFVMQNLSFGAYAYYQNFFNIKIADSCYENLSRYGHLGSMDIILNLQQGLATGKFKSGDKILVMNNSPVAAWSSMLVEV